MVQNTHSLHNLGVSSPPTNPSQKKSYRLRTTTTDPVSRRRWREVVEGSGQLVTHPLLPYPHAATFIHTGSLPGYKSWWHNDTQEKSKNGLKQEIAMKSAMGLHTEDTIKGHWEAKSKYIPSDLFYFLSTIFHFQPPALSHICTHFSSRLGNFSLNFC